MIRAPHVFSSGGTGTCIVGVITALMLSPAVGYGWTSGQEEPPGPQAARRVLSPAVVAPDEHAPNEHAKLLSEAMQRAGLPSLLYSPFQLTTYADSTAPSYDGQLSVRPAPFSQIETLDRSADEAGGNASLLPASRKSLPPRVYTIPGFAALPDHSYSLWDWITGNETCPRGTTNTGLSNTPMGCHTFSSHLGLLNSHHFPPQAEATYQRYHRLALRRAEECAELSQKFAPLRTTRSRETEAMVQECEQEALILEAVGQHFLQDALAVGHMWERWGYPVLGSFPGTTLSERHLRALAVSLIAGLVHGVEAVRHVPDLMSFGDRDLVRFKGHAAAQETPGIGDLHADRLLQEPAYSFQRDLLLDCSAVGLHKVYSRTARGSGAIDANRNAQILSLYRLRDPDPAALGDQEERHSECFAQRATNLAIYAGFGLNRCPLAPPFGSEDDPCRDAQAVVRTVEFLPLLAALLRVTPWFDDGSSQVGPVAEQLKAELVLMSSWVAIRARRAPNETDLASSGLLRPEDEERGLIGVRKNAHGIVPPPPYTDRMPGISAGPEARWIARAFNKAHVGDWCADNETAPVALRDRALTARQGEEFSVAQEICTEFVSRQVRIGGQPSLCEAIGKPGRSFNSPYEDAVVAASRYCSCESQIIVLEALPPTAHESNLWSAHTTTAYEYEGGMLTHEKWYALAGSPGPNFYFFPTAPWAKPGFAGPTYFASVEQNEELKQYIASDPPGADLVCDILPAEPPFAGNGRCHGKVYVYDVTYDCLTGKLTVPGTIYRYSLGGHQGAITMPPMAVTLRSPTVGDRSVTFQYVNTNTTVQCGDVTDPYYDPPTNVGRTCSSRHQYELDMESFQQR